jgi:transcriptional regulator with XRE-family HTH domain
MDERAELLRFGETFRQVREQQGVAVADLAARAEIDAQRIRELEAGRFDPTYDVMIALANGLCIRVSSWSPRTERAAQRTNALCLLANALQRRRGRSYVLATPLRAQGFQRARRIADLRLHCRRGSRRSGCRLHREGRDPRRRRPFQSKPGTFETTWSPTFSVSVGAV